MHLKSLEVSGFKSFAKKASLAFTTPITGIVGPNGSGKSNIAESFRFVLGEQSIKSLRGRRGEDMIWNGGGDGASAAGRANRASVKLVFDNSKRLFPSIDFDEVSIERVVHRDNSNEYLLNGSQVRLKDIVEILGSAHIGATGHHIISQGEADRILSASIRERREMIEDALGLKVYQWKKLESMRKLERTEENMKQVESLRREIAPHIRFLKKQVEKIERAEELRKELIQLYKAYFADEEGYIETERESIAAASAGPRKEAADLERELEEAKKILTGSKGSDAKSGEVVGLESRIKAVRAEKDSITRELGRIEGEMNACRRAIDKEKEKQKRDEFKTIYLKDLEEAVASAEIFQTVKEVISSLRAFISRHRQSVDSSVIADSEKEIEALSREKAGLESRLKDLIEEESRLSKEYESLKASIEKDKDTNRDAEKEVFRVIARQNEVRSALAALSGRSATLDRIEADFKRELGEAASIAGREAVEYDRAPEAGRASSAETRQEQEERRRKIEKHKVRLEDAGGAGGAEVMKEYKETEERDAFLAKEIVDLEKA
ncbi:MAG: AAA family ATPase, partial [Patescibacteria group bacterium]|nr:AAA family ATPase [Patescibacteria group bacterium]